MRPTRSGVALLALGGLFAVAALQVAGAGLLYLPVAVLLAVVAVDVVLGQLNVAGVEVERQLPELYAGEAGRGALVVRNPGPLSTWALELRDGAHARARLSSVPPGGAVRTEADWTLPTRGRVRLGPIGVGSGYPFGLFRHLRTVAAPVVVVVYPAPVRQASGTLDGGAGADDGDPDGVRPWVQGDPFRRIHWKTSARVGRHMVWVRGHSDGALPEVVRVVPGPDLEAHLSAACGRVLARSGAGLPVGLALAHLELPPGSGDAHRRKLLAALALHP